MGYWSGKSALVTGGSSGLGLAIARALLKAGANVIVVARSQEKLAKACEALKSSGRIEAIAADITQPADVDRMVIQSIELFGKLDLLVNCAGSSARGDVQSTTVEDFRKLIELNFLALVSCTRAALPHLLASGGHVVNIGSLASKSASRYMGGYAPSKFAVAAYSQQLRLELAEQGLHVLLVCPGPIAGSQVRDYSAANLPESATRAGAGVKVGRIDPDWLADRILKACEKRKLELVVPRKARLLFAISQLSPALGDWLVRKMT